jgi:nucleotide-binding universal stress UspA family protein
VANPNTEDNLLQLALLLAKTTEGTLLPLHILLDNEGTIVAEAKTQQDQLLAAAERVAHAAVTAVESIARIDDAIDKGILRTAQERHANLIVCGWKGYSTYRDNFFGSSIDNVLRRSPIPVLLTRFTHPIKTTERVFLAVDEMSLTATSFPQLLTLAQTLAAELKASFCLLHVTAGSRRVPARGTAPTRSIDVPMQRVRTNFASYVRTLTANDLLILPAKINADFLGLPVLGVGSETIAHQNPNLSLIVIHIPLER